MFASPWSRCGDRGEELSVRREWEPEDLIEVWTLLDESTGDVVEVGDILTVKITDVDLARRRIALSQTQARTPRNEGDRHS
ncbi:S1 RNA-binding domain-containing protein [Streptomyces sp. T1317-0309]|nr:S1 RNA-binding domain-containing protein [Streptomyces sp. T1317-0309]